MKSAQFLAKCEICGKSGENLSLYSANHKDSGWINVCNECWIKLYEKNVMISGSGGSGKNSNSPCSSCSGCCF